jgi:Mn2+/Fe2+ NRAMP family transporter
MVILSSTFVAVMMDFADIKPINALYWTAIINGMLAPFLLLGILAAASDAKIMCDQPSSTLGKLVVTITAGAMFIAAFAMFVV